MSDGAIGAIPGVVAARPLAIADPVAKIVALPPGLLQDTPLKGEVTANANGAITIQTAQGAIVLELQIALEIGQQITVQIADGGKTIGLVLESDANVPVISKLPLAMPVPEMQNADSVLIHNDTPIAAFAPLQARLVTLPPVFDAATLPLLVKSLAQLPPQNPMPPALAEGLEKLQQLTAILQPASLPVFVPAPAVAATATATAVPLPVQIIHEQAAIISALQQMLASEAAPGNPLVTAASQTLVHLQALAPGQPIVPEILLSLRQQLAGLPPPSPTPPMAMAGTPPVVTSPVPTPQPLIGLILQPMAQTPLRPVENTAQPQVLVLLVKPDGSEKPPQMVGVIALPTPQAMPLAVGQRPVPLPPVPLATVMNAPLPGTVIIVAQPAMAEETTILSMLERELPALPVVKPTPLHTSLGDTWPALEKLFDGAQVQMPPVLQQTLPAPAAQHFPPAMLFFMSVLKNGLADHWLQDLLLDKLPGIEKSGALAQIAQDMHNIAARNDDNLPADVWRPLPLPLQVGDQLLRLQWFYRHPQDDAAQSQDGEAEKPKKRKTRFLLNVPKTGLGDIQIDGLVQEHSMELILRTENALQSRMESDIRTRYAAALETTGMKGALQFQVGRDLYVRA